MEKEEQDYKKVAFNINSMCHDDVRFVGTILPKKKKRDIDIKKNGPNTLYKPPNVISKTFILA